MYREVLKYIRELGEERELSPDRQGEVRECMDGIAGEICGIYGLTVGKSEKGKREKNYSFHGTYQCVARYLTANTESGISIGIYGERSPEKKSRYCICIGTVHAFLHSKKETNEEERERLKKNRKQYYSFIDMKLRDGLCYTYKNMYGSGDEDIKTKDPRTIFVHKEKELKNKDENIIREFVKEKTDTVKDNDDDIEPCYLIEAETEDGKLRTEEELKAEVIKGVGLLMPYYKHIMDYPEIVKNMILYGPPGTGKTYITATYAVLICGWYTLDTLKNMNHSKIMEIYHELEQEGRIGFTTFHQSYGYEDFIEGIRPVLDKEKTDAQNQSEEQKSEKSGNLEYTMEPGVFKAFCEKAEKSKKPYVFIIDEINRGNISRIFGELITLVEESKRKGEADERSVILPYSGLPFSVPSNVYIIGTMNTADRSIALLDTALRRRFSFVEMMPDTEVLKDIKIEVPEMPDTVDKKAGKSTIDIQKLLKIINQRIEVLYDREHTIGHAYFCGLKKTATLDGLKNVFKKSVLPLLQEYFFDDYEKIAMVLGDNQKSNSNYKFIVEDNEKDIRALFGKDLETEVIDMLQRKRYMINEKAFDYAESYIQIYEPSWKN
ncbi:McrB family protein [Blautia sp. MSJ-36]|uniref:McrB family protein n=1 Tax=Blautia sp. MSJ-36 TaxID=2841530 RepID=UPI001C109899|nr:AAA family ATPase [Blautia sp. MSJ-36]MBU5448851.1 AAA family ATPase [Blautia sp. MSJ-36]